VLGCAIMLVLAGGVVFVVLSQDWAATAIGFLGIVVPSALALFLAPEATRRQLGFPTRRGETSDVQDEALGSDRAGLVDSLVQTGYRLRNAGVLAQEMREDSNQMSRLLARVRQDYAQRLQQALHPSVHLAFGLDTAPEAIAQGLDRFLPRDRVSRSLPVGTTVRDAFRDAGDWDDGRLLILGEPGAGKTMMLLELGQMLIDETHEEPPAVPVYVPLSAWSSRGQRLRRAPLFGGSPFEQFELYLAAQVSQLYSVPSRTAHRWLHTGRLLLLLDGLDEIADVTERASCVTSLNQFLRECPTSAVVCCRRYDYEALDVQLDFREAVAIRPLQEAEVMRTVAAGGARLSGVRAALKDDLALRELCRSPLFLAMVMLAYADQPARRIRASGSAAERRGRLLDDYVDRQLRIQTPGGARSETGEQGTVPSTDRKWLEGLAHAMRGSDETIFLLDRIQPNWLPMGVRALALVPALAAGALARGLMSTPGAIGLSLILLYTLAGSFTSRDRLTWSWRASFSLSNILIAGAVGGLVGLFTGLIHSSAAPKIRLWPIDVVMPSPLAGLLLGILFGIPVFSTLFGFSSAAIATKVTPYEGLRRSLIIGLTVAALLLIVTPPVYLLVVKVAGVETIITAGTLLQVTDSTTLNVGIDGGLSVGLVFALIAGLGAVLGHAWVRLWLWVGQRGPARYVTWLENMVARRLLYRSGAGYVFIHRFLQDHLSGASAEEEALADAEDEDSDVASPDQLAAREPA
jgi:hypothetical protein